MYSGIYTLQKVARSLNATIVNFPIAFGGAPLDKNWTNDLHKHDTMEMVLVTGGHGIHIQGAYRAPVRKGDVLLVYPGLLHGYEDAETMSRFNILYDPSKLPIPVLDGVRIPLFTRFFPQDLTAAGQHATATPILRLDNSEDLERVIADAKLLLEELTGKRPGNMMASVVRLMSVILLALRLGQPLVPDEREHRNFPMGRILEHLNKNFTHAVSVQDLARMSNYSIGAFQRKFKALTGYSVGEYILRKRIDLGKAQLRGCPERSIGDVGFECGFLDANYFSRKFRQITGMTPREYRTSDMPDTQFVE